MSVPEAAGRVGARRVALDIAIQIVGMAGNLALGVVVTVLLARQLGDGPFGQWSTILAITGFVGFFADLGLRQVVVRQIAAEPEREADWLGAQLSLVGLLALPATALSAVVLAVIARGHAMLVAGLVLSLLVLQSPVGNLSVVFQLRTRNDVTTAITTVKSVLWLIVVIVLSLLDGGLIAFAIWFQVTSLIATAITAAVALRWVPLRSLGRREEWGPLLRLTLPVAVAAFLSLAYARIDQVLVFLLAGSRDAGLYGVAYRVLDQIQFVPAAVLTTLLPLLAAALRDDRERLREIVEQAATFLSIASLGALALTIAAAGPIVRLLFGTEFAPAAPALPVLMGAFVAICFGYLVGNMIIVLGLQRRNVWIALAALILNVGLNLALIPPFGFKAAAWVTLATEVVWLLLAGRLVIRELAIRLDLHRLPRVIVAAAATGGAVAGARAGGAGVGVLLAVAAVLYPALILSLRAITTAEVVRLVRGGAS